MKLLIYSHFFAPSIGGVESIAQSLATGLSRITEPRGIPEFQVTVATQTSREQFDDEVLAFRVIRRPGRLTLFRLIRQCDVLHVSGPAILPLALATLLGKPCVLEHHGFQAICPNGQLFVEASRAQCPGHFMAGRHLKCLQCNSNQGWIASARMWFLTFIRRSLAARVQANVSPTAWLAGMLRVPRIVPIPHGLETWRVPRPTELLRRDHPLILYQGRLVSTKGAEILLQAAGTLLEHGHAIELLLVGDGPERARLESIAARPPLTGKVRFAGRLSPEDLERQLSQATIVVVPSLAGEVFGLVVAENMLRGVPLIVSDLGAFVEVAGDSCAVFRAGDASDLFRRLKSLLDDPELRTAMGIAARRRALEMFSAAEMVGRHAELYHEIRERG